MWFACSLYLRDRYQEILSDNAGSSAASALNDAINDANSRAEDNGGSFIGKIGAAAVASAYLDRRTPDGRLGIGFVHVVINEAPEQLDTIVAGLQEAYRKVGGTAAFAKAALAWTPDQAKKHLTQLMQAVSETLPIAHASSVPETPEIKFDRPNAVQVASTPVRKDARPVTLNQVQLLYRIATILGVVTLVQLVVTAALVLMLYKVIGH